VTPTYTRRLTYRSDKSVLYEYYYLNGERHRAGGPAVIWYHPDGTVEGDDYYLNGESEESL